MQMFKCFRFWFWWLKRKKNNPPPFVNDYETIPLSTDIYPISTYQDQEECCSDDNANIHIQDEKTITTLKLHDCMSIHIINCPKITRIPDMCQFNLLETICIQHCDINTCNTYFPNTLRSLEISYCSMKHFTPQNIPSTLAQLNLSFNKLCEIPKCIEDIYKANPNIHINLKNNDFWYTMYSNLSAAMISPETVKELILAHKLNIVGTDKLRLAQRILESKKFSKEAAWLAKETGIALKIRRENDINLTHNNAQNVHLTSVQSSMMDSIKYILNYKSNINIDDLDIIIRDLCANADVSTTIRETCNKNSMHSVYKTTFKRIFIKVYAIACDHPNKNEILKILCSEIQDGMKTCLTGQITRVVNSLNGFVSEINIGISKNEEVSNSIVAMRKKYAIMYPDPEEYINETIPAVWQLLEDMCVGEAEHDVWLEYV
jgi:hypothetical protein